MVFKVLDEPVDDPDGLQIKSGIVQMLLAFWHVLHKSEGACSSCCQLFKDGSQEVQSQEFSQEFEDHCFRCGLEIDYRADQVLTLNYLHLVWGVFIRHRVDLARKELSDGGVLLPFDVLQSTPEKPICVIHCVIYVFQLMSNSFEMLSKECFYLFDTWIPLNLTLILLVLFLVFWFGL